MAEIAATKLVTTEEIFARLDLYKRNPSALQRVAHELLEEITSGKAKILDPTSPFAFLIESSAVNTAFAVNEVLSILAAMYPSLSQTQDDLYHHMSDKDYINRFATPSEATFTVTIPVNEIMSKLVWDASKNAYRATIARDTTFSVDGFIFTLLYPIDILRFENGVVQISYDNSIDSPIGNLESNMISYAVKRQADLTSLLFFDVKVKQFAVQSTEFPVQSSGFKHNVPYVDQFYMARVFFANNANNNQWEEIAVTHSDFVYDLKKTTAVLTDYGNSLDVYIPKIYLTKGMVSGKIRVDLYTSKGAVSVNLANYKPDSFSMRMAPIDDIRDTNVFTNAMANMSCYAFSSGIVSGGSSAVDFETLRDRVITNSNGAQVLPITNRNIPAAAEALGFSLVGNVDVLTNRIFLATQKLPKPKNQKLATSANITLASFVTNSDYLKNFPSVKTNVNRSTILSSNLYKNTNGIVELLTPAQVAALRAMTKLQLTTEVNNNQYLYTPYHYVLDDTDNEFSVRAYDLDHPVAKDISFESQNQTLQLPVNTLSYTFKKIPDGYRLSILTTSGNFYKQLPDSTVFAQIGYYPLGESKMAYINGVLSGKDAEENRLWTFDILTNFDIDANDRFTITNAKMFSSESINTPIDLSQQFHIFHATSSIVDGFIPDEADALLGKFVLPPGTVASTHETITLEIGKSLKSLWSKTRSFVSNIVYKTHNFDVPLNYEQNVYKTNPVTNSTLFFEDGKPHRVLEHKKGDPVLNAKGEQVYKHRKGDLVLDDAGKPVILESASVDKEIDMLFVDGRQFFVDDPAFLDYNDELVNVLTDWIVDDLNSLQNRLLEQTYVYFYPKSTIGNVNVYVSDGAQDTVSAEQSLTVDLYVKADVYNDSSVRSSLTSKTIASLDEWIGESVVNVTESQDNLKKIYGSSVQSLKVSGVGGVKDYQILTLVNEQNRLGLKRILDIQLDGKLIMREDVTVNFYLIP